jgi:hypothetical protein
VSLPVAKTRQPFGQRFGVSSSANSGTDGVLSRLLRDQVVHRFRVNGDRYMLRR